MALELCDERAGDAGAAALDDGPADRVGENRHDEAEAAAQRVAERLNRVRRAAGEGRARLGGVQPRGEHSRRLKAERAEADHRQRRDRQRAHRAERVRDDLLRVLDERAHQAPVCPRVGAEALRRLLHGAPDARRATAVEGVRVGELRLAQRDLLRAERPKERGGRGERVDRRADVVREAGERELRGLAAATRRLRSLEDLDREACARERHGGGETVRPRSDDYSIRCALGLSARTGAHSSSTLPCAATIALGDARRERV